MTRSLIILVLTVLAGYGLVEAWPLIAGPSLSITTPRNGESFPGGIVNVAGTASRIAMLSLDGAPVLHDENGSFSPTLTFPHGASLLTFVAIDRFGRRITVTRSVFVPD
ncbi:MAG TPA: hypothetical protein VMV62_01035 [Candidatus Paceibacterota bacterium]|nr:hypothetical protein [Candidatus Paceibacterota bacterium]